MRCWGEDQAQLLVMTYNAAALGDGDGEFEIQS
jgi:hypothetical protein